MAKLLLLLLVMVMVMSLRRVDVVQAYYEDSAAFQAMQTKLDLLTNEVERLKQFTGVEPPTQSILPFELLRVSRRLQGDVMTFSLVFRADHTQDVDVWWRNTADHQLITESSGNVTTSTVKNGIVRTSAMVQPGNESSLMVQVATEYEGVSLYLGNDFQGNIEETYIPLPLLIVEPEGDLVYSNGEDVTFKFTHPSNQPRPDPGSRLDSSTNDIWYSLRNLSSGAIISSYAPDALKNFVKLTESKRYLHSAEDTVTIRTSEYPTSGFINVASAVNLKTSLIQRVQVVIYKTLRPEGQPGPFPNSYLYVFNPQNMYTGQGSQVVCRYGEPCTLTCSAYGDKLQDIGFSRITDSGHENDLETASYVRTYYADALYKFLPEPEAVGGTYQCAVVSRTGTVAVVNYGVRYITPAKVVKEDSGAEWINDSEIRVTCAFEAGVTAQFEVEVNYGGYMVETRVEDSISEGPVTISRVFNSTKNIDMEYNSPYWMHNSSMYRRSSGYAEAAILATCTVLDDRDRPTETRYAGKDTYSFSIAPPRN